MAHNAALVRRVVRLLNGHIELDQLSHLREALLPKADRIVVEGSLAIGLDSNVLLNMGKGRSGADVVDYLVERHQGPVILPAQSVTEFWNNQASGIHGLGERVQLSFDSLAAVVGELDPDYHELKDGAERLLVNFRERYGHVLEERIASNLGTLLDGLAGRALVPQLSRELLGPIGIQRKATRTPPGFKDDGLGDFYVWAEFLYGLLLGRGQASFDRAVLVTDDKKTDWSTKGTVHPVLAAEVSALVGTPFDVWSLRNLTEYVQEQLSTTDEPVSEPPEGVLVIPPATAGGAPL